MKFCRALWHIFCALWHRGRAADHHASAKRHLARAEAHERAQAALYPMPFEDGARQEARRP